jgi:hypothetical protein
MTIRVASRELGHTDNQAAGDIDEGIGLRLGYCFT